MSTRDLLERWRPSATPGAPSAAGVPADRVAERSAELESVLSLLAEAQAEAERITADAAAEAERRKSAAHEHARAIVSEAHRTARAERSAAAASAHAAGEASAGQITAQAEQEAAEIARRARIRQPDLVARVLAEARAEIASMTEQGAVIAGWVGASVRARALAHRRLGTAGARELAAAPSLERALDMLADSPYGHDVRRAQSLAQAQHAVAATLLWHLRVLAGWLPRGDARVLRVLAGGFEVANVDERLREVAGAPHQPAFRLGGLSTTWAALGGATSSEEMRTLLARSAWGDPGADDPDGIRLGMRLAWAARVSAAVPPARPWAVGAATLPIARAHVLERRPATPQTIRVATWMLGARWPETHTLTGFTDSLPADARWSLASAQDPADLWRAEALWWTRVTTDGFRLLRQPVTSPDPVLGAVAVLSSDAWQVRAALEVAARAGSSPAALEAFDAVA